jgi:hypothetical protein
LRRESVYGVLTFAFAKPFAIADYRRRKDPADPGRTRGGSSKKNSVGVLLRTTPSWFKTRLILRLYQTRAELLDGNFSLPASERWD